MALSPRSQALSDNAGAATSTRAEKCLKRANPMLCSPGFRDGFPSNQHATATYSTQRRIRSCSRNPRSGIRMSPTPAGTPVRLAIGITGHRGGNPRLAGNGAHIAAVLAAIFAEIETALSAERVAAPALTLHPTRLHTLLAHGVDHAANSPCAAARACTAATKTSARCA